MDHSKPHEISKRGWNLNYNETFTVPKEDVPDKQVAEQIAKQCCNLMERVPFPPPRTGVSELKTVLTGVVTRSLVPDFKIRLRGCSPLKGKQAPNKGAKYTAEYRAVDPSTGKHFHATFAIYTTRVGLNKPIPPLLAHVEVAGFEPSGHAKTNEDKAKESYAYDLGVYVAYKMHHLFASQEALKVKRTLLISEFLNTGRSQTGPYGGKRLYRYTVSVNSRCIHITMSAAVRASLENTTGGIESLPEIRVRGLAYARAKQVVQIMVLAWMRT